MIRLLSVRDTILGSHVSRKVLRIFQGVMETKIPNLNMERELLNCSSGNAVLKNAGKISANHYSKGV